MKFNTFETVMSVAMILEKRFHEGLLPSGVQHVAVVLSMA
jgi:hypothetical protein